MSKAHPPELKKFMDKKLSLKLNGGRHVQGILRGLDPFMNLVIDECVEMATSGQQNNIGMVVIRGNSIIMLEALERGICSLQEETLPCSSLRPSELSLRSPAATSARGCGKRSPLPCSAPSAASARSWSGPGSLLLARDAPRQPKRAFAPRVVHSGHLAVTEELNLT
ncbi:hypothetical protein R6Z07F_011303 [Ovis aries]